MPDIKNTYLRDTSVEIKLRACWEQGNLKVIIDFPEDLEWTKQIDGLSECARGNRVTSRSLVYVE